MRLYTPLPFSDPVLIEVRNVCNSAAYVSSSPVFRLRAVPLLCVPLWYMRGPWPSLQARSSVCLIPDVGFPAETPTTFAVICLQSLPTFTLSVPLPTTFSRQDRDDRLIPPGPPARRARDFDVASGRLESWQSRIRVLLGGSPPEG